MPPCPGTSCSACRRAALDSSHRRARRSACPRASHVGSQAAAQCKRHRLDKDSKETIKLCWLTVWVELGSDGLQMALPLLPGLRVPQGQSHRLQATAAIESI